MKNNRVLADFSREATSSARVTSKIMTDIAEYVRPVFEKAILTREKEREKKNEQARANPILVALPLSL